MSKRWNVWVWALLLTTVFLPTAVFAAPAPQAEVEFQLAEKTTNCFAPEGSPWEAGGNVYIKVKNNCATTQGFSWEVGTYNYGVYGSPIGTPETGSRAVKPGKTTTICAKKPAGSGKYCFRFKIKNKDALKPDDEFFRWLNNIVVACLPGGTSSGTFEVGGSGFLTTDVGLAVAVAPPGWSLDLSTYYVSMAEFPATVTWNITAPPDAIPGEQVYFRIEGFDPSTGDYIGDAEIEVLVGEEEPQPIRRQGKYPTGTAAGAGNSELPPDESEPEPEPVEPLVPNFYAASEENGLAISGREILVAWNESGFLGSDISVVFEYYGLNGWEEIGNQNDQVKFSPVGMTLVYWDTTELPAGDYQVRVIMSDDWGNVGTVEKILTITKVPFAEATASFSGEDVVFDGASSYDPDDFIVDWEWDFGDGTTASGSVVTHTYTTPGSYPVDLTVTDSQGNETTAYCTVDTVDEFFVCFARSCGCESMKVNGEGDTAGMDMYWMAAPDKKKLGGVNTVPNPPPAGGGPYRLIYNFEVEATLVAGSDPALCDTEQWANGTWTAGGDSGHKPDEDGNDYPYGSDDYAPDNYTGNSRVQESKGGKIRWVDGPGLEGLSAAVIGAGGASFKAEFFAMVTGPLGTCQCSFEVVMSVDAAGKVTQKPEMKNVVCS